MKNLLLNIYKYLFFLPLCVYADYGPYTKGLSAETFKPKTFNRWKTTATPTPTKHTEVIPQSAYSFIITPYKHSIQHPHIQQLSLRLEKSLPLFPLFTAYSFHVSLPGKWLFIDNPHNTALIPITPLDES